MGKETMHKYLLPLLNSGGEFYNTFQKPPQRILQDHVPIAHKGNTTLFWLLLPALCACSLESHCLINTTGLKENPDKDTILWVLL